jgi:hypothetical protein
MARYETNKKRLVKYYISNKLVEDFGRNLHGRCSMHACWPGPMHTGIFRAISTFFTFLLILFSPTRCDRRSLSLDLPSLNWTRGSFDTGHPHAATPRAGTISRTRTRRRTRGTPSRSLPRPASHKPPAAPASATPSPPATRTRPHVHSSSLVFFSSPLSSDHGRCACL